MKIKTNKLLAGGLMTVVTCALVGSITGTFAWYQYSNASTVSIHGKSVGSSKNLELQLEGGSWKFGNLTWDEIAAANNGTPVDTAADPLTYKPLEMKPLSNGGNADGLGDLNTKQVNNTAKLDWYGNPQGGDDLPAVDESEGGFVQFKFKARYAEVSGNTKTYPASTLYITDIGAKEIANADPNLSNALRLHIDFGTVQFLVNPFNDQEDVVELSAALTDTSKYDWENTNSNKVYQLPQSRYTETTAATENTKRQLNANSALTAQQAAAFTAAFPANAKEEGNTLTAEEAADYNATLTPVKAGEYDHEAATLKSLAHADVLKTIKADGSPDENDDDFIEVAIPESATGEGIEITVTAWLEGFAPETSAVNASKWWNAATTIGSDLIFGFQLSAFKTVVPNP